MKKHLLFFKTTIKITLIEQYNLYNYSYIKNEREHLKSIQITNSEQFYKPKTILHAKNNNYNHKKRKYTEQKFKTKYNL